MWHIEVFDTLPSTQDYIKSGEPHRHGLVIQANMQTSGHGRHGREWVSLPDNLFLSFSLIPETLVRDKTGLLALGIGTALSKTIKSYISDNAEVFVKWPNDVLIDGRKCAGLLLEIHQNCIIIGVGVNISCSPSQEASTYLTKYGCTASSYEFRDEFLNNVSDIYQSWINQDYEQIRSDFLEYSFPRFTLMSVKTPQKVYRGEFYDIATDGALILQDESNKIITLTSGQVFVTD